MMQIIKFTDVDITGCGDNVEVYIQVEGRMELTNKIIGRTKNAIGKYIDEYSGEWNTNNIVNVACMHLELEGYTCRPLIPDYEIDF